MDSHQIALLCVNANCLAELALRQLGAEILARPLAPVQSAEASEIELATRLATMDFSAMDFGALDGLNLDVPVGDADRDGDRDPVAVQGPPLAAAQHALAGQAAHNTADDVLDIASYLASAYASVPRLYDPFGTGQRRIDAAAISAKLAALPVALAPLTGPLDAVAFGHWLVLYRSGHEGLSALVAELTQCGAD